jgi:hypothetical protein
VSTANVNELESQLAQVKTRLQSMCGKGGGSWEAICAGFEEQRELERKLAASKGEAYAKPIDIGFLPSADCEAFIQGRLSTAYLIFGAMEKPQEPGGNYNRVGWAVVRLGSCEQSKFGYPNDEALPGHPLYSKGFSGLGVFEVINSTWEDSLREQNRIAFPDPNMPPWPWRLRHLIFPFKENVLECLVKDFEVRVENRPFTELVTELMGTVCRD